MRITKTKAQALFLLTAILGLGLADQGNPPPKPKAPRVGASCGKCDGRSVEIVNDGGGKCLDVHKPDWQKDGALVQLWECKSDERAQSWRWEGNAIVNGGGKCLEATAPTQISQLGGVRMWTCNGRPQQKWEIKGQTITNGNGMCLDAHAGTLDRNGGRVQMWTCVSGATPQKWSFYVR